MIVARSISMRIARLLLGPCGSDRRRVPRNRPQCRLERLEGRCLLSIAEFPLPTVHAGPNGITVGPDGNLWFTERLANQIGMINASTDAITEFPLPTANAGPAGIVAGPDGNLWFTEGDANNVGMINPTTHGISEFSLPSTTVGPAGITAGPDGNLWFVVENRNLNASSIGMINPTTRAITEFAVPTVEAGPSGITVGPDNNIWFTEGTAAKIGDINPTTDAITEYPTPTADSGPGGIVSGPDGNLWFTESGNGAANLGMINPTTRSITEFPLPTGDAGPGWIASGPDGNIWFTEGAVFSGPLSKIGMIDPNTDIFTDFPNPYANANAAGITAGPDGNVWFTDGVDGGTNSIGVVSLNTKQLVVTLQPPASVTAGTVFGLTVKATDRSGNVDSSFNGTVTVALANNPGGSTLGGTITAIASGGVATFSGLTLNKATSGYTLQVSSNGVTSATTSAITVTPAAASQMAVTEQPPASVTAGSNFGLQASIEDIYGNLETTDNASVSVSLDNNPTGTTLGGTLSATAAQGVATFSSLTLTKAASGYTLRLSTSGLNSATTGAITVVPAAPATLVQTAAPPDDRTAGTVFGLTVNVDDAYGNQTTFSGNVAVGIAGGPAGGIVSGQTTVSASAGVATFAKLELTKVGSYTLQISSGNLPAVTTGTITVTPAAPSQLTLTSQRVGGATAGTSFGLTVQAEDPYGNPNPSFAGNVAAAIETSPPGSSLGGKTTVGASDGIASFSGLILDKAGSYTLTVSSNGLSSATINAFVVAPAAAAQLTLVSEPPSSVTAGTGFGLEIEAEDPFGNLATGFGGTITAALSAGAGSATLGGPVTATTVGGVATFAGLVVDQAGSGYRLEVTSGSLTGGMSGAFTVTAAAASQLAITTPAPSSVIAGNPFDLSVAVEDPYGNVATSYDGPVAIALSNNPVGGSLNGALTSAASDGLVTFSRLTLDSAASGYSIAATSGNLNPATISSINVVPAAASRLVVVVSPPTTMTAGADFGLAISAEDPYGNRATGFTGNVMIGLANDPGGATLLGGPITVAATAGVASFPAFLTLDKAAAGYTIEATSNGLTPVITGGITVAPQPATHLVVVQQPPSSVNAGSGFGLVVAALDQFGNIDSNFGGRVSIAPAAGSGATLGTGTSVVASGGIASFSMLSMSQANGPVSLQITSNGLTGTVTSPVTVMTTAQTVPVTPISPKSPALSPLVTMNDVQLIENKRGQVTEILIGFSGGLNAAEAENTATYLLTAAARGGSFTAKGAQVIRLRSAVYNASHDTVALYPEGRSRSEGFFSSRSRDSRLRACRIATVAISTATAMAGRAATLSPFSMAAGRLLTRND